jgi:hypothetical protein
MSSPSYHCQKYLRRADPATEAVFHAPNQPVARDSGVRTLTGVNAGANTIKLA